MIPGDFDRNGMVEQADYVIWRSSFGSTNALHADGNENGVVDAGDFTVWRDNLFSTSFVAASSVVSDRSAPAKTVPARVPPIQVVTTPFGLRGLVTAFRRNFELGLNLRKPDTVSSQHQQKESGDKSPHSKERLRRLLSRLERLNSLQLAEVEQFVAKFESIEAVRRIQHENTVGAPRSQPKDWPHAPIHRLHGKGTYIVTAGTLQKEHFFRDVDSLDYLEGELLSKAKAYHWQLEAWAVFSNHYHFVGHALEDAKTLEPFLRHLHADTAREINRRQSELDRQVWFNFWDTKLTYEKSYFARLNYVHQNAVKHGLVLVANQYRWCSAAWFERTATPVQVKTIYSFKTDKITIVDDFDVPAPR